MAGCRSQGSGGWGGAHRQADAANLRRGHVQRLEQRHARARQLCLAVHEARQRHAARQVVADAVPLPMCGRVCSIPMFITTYVPLCQCTHRWGKNQVKVTVQEAGSCNHAKGGQE